MPRSASAQDHDATYSEVRVRGRLSGATTVTLPSGDEVITFRVIVDRDARQRGPAGKVRVDALECVAWTAATRRKIAAYRDGDLIEVDGWLERRFWKAGSVPASRTEIVAREVRR